MKMTYENLAAYILEYPQIEAFAAIIDSEGTKIADIADHLRYIAYDETADRPAMTYLTQVAGFTPSKYDIEWDPNHLDAVFAFTTLIGAEADFSSSELTRCLWTTFGLGGYNDGDYFGGYIAEIAEILSAVREFKA